MTHREAEYRDAERQALKAAATLAGLKVHSLSRDLLSRLLVTPHSGF